MGSLNYWPPTSTYEHGSEHHPTYRQEVSAMNHAWLWQPYRRADGTAAGWEPLETEDGERSDEELAQWFARKLVAWPEPREQRRTKPAK